jgi:hypothetical protein
MPIICLRCRMKLDGYKPLPNLRQDERDVVVTRRGEIRNAGGRPTAASTSCRPLSSSRAAAIVEMNASSGMLGSRIVQES